MSYLLFGVPLIAVCTSIAPLHYSCGWRLLQRTARMKLTKDITNYIRPAADAAEMSRWVFNGYNGRRRVKRTVKRVGGFEHLHSVCQRPRLVQQAASSANQNTAAVSSPNDARVNRALAMQRAGISSENGLHCVRKSLLLSILRHLGILVSCLFLSPLNCRRTRRRQIFIS